MLAVGGPQMCLGLTKVMDPIPIKCTYTNILSIIFREFRNTLSPYLGEKIQFAEQFFFFWTHHTAFGILVP